MQGISFFINLARKSDIRDMLTLVVMWSISQLWINLFAICPNTKTTCAIKTTITKFKSLVSMPTSMTDCVRNGNIKLIILPVSIAKKSCIIKRLYGYKYFNRFLKFNLESSSFCSANFEVGSNNNAIPIVFYLTFLK